MIKELKKINFQNKIKEVVQKNDKSLLTYISSTYYPVEQWNVFTSYLLDEYTNNLTQGYTQDGEVADGLSAEKQGIYVEAFRMLLTKKVNVFLPIPDFQEQTMKDAFKKKDDPKKTTIVSKLGRLNFMKNSKKFNLYSEVITLFVSFMSNKDILKLMNSKEFQNMSDIFVNGVRKRNVKEVDYVEPIIKGIKNEFHS